MSEYKVMKGERFPSALNLTNIDEYPIGEDEPSYAHPVAKFLDEIRLLKFEQAVMNKPDWRKKINDSAILAKWKDESAQYEVRPPVFDYAISELRWLAELGDPKKGIEPSGVDLVWRSDKLISSELRETFMKLCEQFAASKAERDYHPGSNDQVVNLVHPSLFCLVYGATKDKGGNTIENTNIPGKAIDWRYTPTSTVADVWSRHYQWLPAEFLVDTNGKVKIASYINSLPSETGLYPVISEIFERMVPMFNYALTDLRANRERVRFPKPNDYYWWKNDDLYYPDELDYADVDNETRNKKMEEWENSREVIPVPVPVFDAGAFKPKEEDVVDLKGHRLQVIVKIGSIELTPDKPSFPAGNWHVEGMANEKIVATGIYYYDSENIEDSCLNFRQGVEFDLMYFEQDDDHGARVMFGAGREDPSNQEAGSVQTPPGRVLVFPNIYQHAVGSFTLKDKTKPGHRKILVFFLVDPTSRIISTERVPPQDVSWHDNQLKTKLGTDLPVELAEKIQGQLGYSMTLEEAKKHRLKLMKERTVAKDYVTENIFARPFSLCEH